MGTTPTYSWPYPESSAYVADGATAMENLADAIDTTVSDFGNWTTFTPQWTNLTVGNATQDAAWARVNDVIFVQFRLVWGSQTTMTSQPRFDLPVTSTNYVIYHQMGVCSLYDTGTAVYPAFVAYQSQSAYIRRPVVSGSNLSSAGLQSTTPFTWTTGDYMMGFFTYRAA